LAHSDPRGQANHASAEADLAMKVAVLGAAGRMGRQVCRAISEAADMELVAAVDPGAAGEACEGHGAGGQPLVISGDLSAVAASGAEVAVDFTVASAAVANAIWCSAAGVHAVIGTSGLESEALARLSEAFDPTRGVGCLVAPNFAIGAVMLIRLAQMAAPWFETVEIVEAHHDAKVDAPSGTAVYTAERIAAASSDWAADPTRSETLPGARGAVGPGGLRIHSLRLRGAVAHQEVVFGTAGQTLTLRHDTYDRSSFMPGVLLAVRSVASRPGLTVGLEKLLDLA